MAQVNSLQQVLQEVFILVQGSPADYEVLQEWEQVINTYGWQPLISLVEKILQFSARFEGYEKTIQKMANYGFGLSLSFDDAKSLADQIRSGEMSWTELVTICVMDTSSLGRVLDARAVATTQAFAALHDAGKGYLVSEDAPLYNAVVAGMQQIRFGQTNFDAQISAIEQEILNKTGIALNLRDYITWVPVDSGAGAGGNGNHDETGNDTGAGPVDVQLPDVLPALRKDALAIQWLDYEQPYFSAEWSKKVITVGFPQQAPAYWTGPFEMQKSGFLPIPEKLQDPIFEAMANALKPVDLQLARAANNNGDINVTATESSAGAAGWATYPSNYANDPHAGDITFDRNVIIDNSQRDHIPPTDSFFSLVTHEFGHALGLKHPFEEGGQPIFQRYDNKLFSVMSYNAPNSLFFDFKWGVGANGKITLDASLQSVYRTDFGILDLAALHTLYGHNPNDNPGDTAYQIAAPSVDTWAFKTISDYSGVDTLDFSQVDGGIRLNLNPGTLSDVSPRDAEGWEDKLVQQGLDYYAAQGVAVSESTVRAMVQQFMNVDAVNDLGQYKDDLWDGKGVLGIAQDTIIENVVATRFDDSVIDNAANNVIHLGTGNDTVFLFGAGNDTVFGESGTDVAVINRPLNAVSIYRDGNATIISSGDQYVRLYDVEYVTNENRSFAYAANSDVFADPNQITSNIIGALPSWYEFNICNYA